MNGFNNITKFMQRHVWNVPTFGHAVMVACAVASFDNVRSFFAAIHATGLIATGLGVAIGAALVMAAGLLSGMGNSWRNPRFQLVGAVTLLLALLSGGVQAAAYAMHGLNLWAAVALGLSLPVVGELGVSLAVAAYEQEQKARRLAQADDEMEAKINAAIDGAMGDIDMASSRKSIEKAAAMIVKSKLDTLLARRIGTPMPTETETEPAKSRQIADYSPDSLPAANAERQRIAAERQRAIVELLTTCGAMTTSEIVSRLRDDFNIEASERTVRADLATLADAGQVGKSGRQWWAQAMIAELPEPAVIHTNGMAH